MKTMHMINTIGKRIHTSVKENTPRCHKDKAEMCFYSKGPILLHIIQCFLPHHCANIGREVKLMLPNTYQEKYDTNTCMP